MVIWLYVSALRVFYVHDDDVHDVVHGDGDDGCDDDLHDYHLIMKMRILTQMSSRPSLYLMMIVPFVDCFFYNILLINYTNLSFN